VCLGIMKGSSLSRSMGTLLLSSREDIASMSLLVAVRELGGWGQPEQLPHGTVFRHNRRDVDLLLIDELHIYADDIDAAHESLTGSDVSEVLVLSRHVSVSKTPSLTLHAIGVPGETPHGDRGQAGGIKGRIVPPSPRFGALFRTMSALAVDRGLDEKYDLTMETTHHGPVLTSPTLYIEIGSTPDQWGDERAAKVWADTLSTCLGLSGSNQVGSWKGSGDVMIGLGGGHYAPRHRSVISQSDVWVGHLLANYALSFDEQTMEEGLPHGSWRHAVTMAIESTRIAFPGGSVFAHLDRKSFKGWQRQALASLLSEFDVPLRRGKQIL